MPKLDNTKPSPFISLGISAIDLLCCAFVSGLVMFLVLASPGIDVPARAGANGVAVGLTLKYRVETSDAIVALRFKNNKQGQPEYVDFFSDAAPGSHVVSSVLVRNILVERRA
jgi:hypothetical protein